MFWHRVNRRATTAFNNNAATQVCVYTRGVSPAAGLFVFSYGSGPEQWRVVFAPRGVRWRLGEENRKDDAVRGGSDRAEGRVFHRKRMSGREKRLHLADFLRPLETSSRSDIVRGSRAYCCYTRHVTAFLTFSKRITNVLFASIVQSPLRTNRISKKLFARELRRIKFFLRDSNRVSVAC